MSLEHVKKCIQQGQFQQAQQLANDLLIATPDDCEVLYLLAVCHRYKKQYQDACQCLEKLLALAPDFSRAHQELGHNNHALSQIAPAVEHYLKAVKNNPSLYASWKRIEELSEVKEQQETARLNLNYLKSLPKLLLSVLSFIHEDRLEKAEKLCRHFLMGDPNHVEGMRLLAKIADKHHVLDDAEFLLSTCYGLEPNNYWVQFDYIHVLNRRQKFELAHEKAQALIAALPNDTTTRLTLANQQAAIGLYQQAIDNYQLLIEKEKDNHNPLIPLLLGHTYKTIGKQSEAITAYQTAIKKDPLLCDAYWSLANLKTYTFDSQMLSQMQRIATKAGLATESAVQVQFALGKAFEDSKEYQLSFEHYRKGNQLKRSVIDYDYKVMNNNFNLQKQFFTVNIAQQLKAFGHQTEEPIFILGLPRTGSTLVEQILSSHSLIDGTLELPNILAYVQELNGRKFKDKEGKYPKVLSSLTSSTLTEFGQRYLDETRVHRDGAPYFTDKMPNNFRHIGLIKSILPNAKIIDTRRSPMSCCFSVFKQLFAEGQEFSYSVNDIVEYYQGYLDLMTHWHTVYPGEILTVEYESMVSEPQQTIQMLFDYLGLDAEAGCFEFHKTKRAVRTASSEQVRQPINQKGREQWKHFEPYLTELATKLEGY